MVRTWMNRPEAFRVEGNEVKIQESEYTCVLGTEISLGRSLG